MRSVRHERFCVLAGLATIAAFPVLAEKKVLAKIEHSAMLAGALQSRPFVLGDMSGECAKEFGDLLARDLRARGFTHAEAPQAGAGSPGAPLVVSVRVDRCHARPREALFGPGLPATHISKTEGRFLASVRVVDSAAGKEIAVLEVRGEADRQNESMTSIPEYPSVADVRALAVQNALAEARHLYAPWIERREIWLNDGKECDLRSGFDLAKAGDYDAFAKQARGAAEGCRAKPKDAAAAWYNYGVALLLVKEYDNAIAAFEEAQRIKANSSVPELVELCRREQSIKAAKRVRPEPARPPDTGAQTGMVMTNELIVKMVQGNVDAEEIVGIIKNHPGRFSLGPEEESRLRQANVPDAVISAMREKK